MKNKALLNILCSTFCQLITILSGLIVPRLLLASFGSEANGLISSLTQFLNYISLIEGGIGSVVLTALYGPLAKKNNQKLSSVMKAGEKFFKQIAYIFVVYTIVLACVYPVFIRSSFSWIFISSLTIILSIGLFIQYFFSITYKLLLQADQKMYIVQLLQIVITVLNLVAVVVAIKVFPNLHIVKLCSALLYIIQPIVFSRYVKKRYTIMEDVEPDKQALSQRWACFGQNLAYFIHSNTDVIVLTLFSDLKTVSVYSVYFLVVSHLQSFFKSFSHAFNPLIGKAIAVHDYDRANKYVDLYEFIIVNVATILFGCCMYLLPTFVLLYTDGVTDANYYRPIFSIIIIFAEYIYCIRDPYVSVVYAAGKFKETAKSAYIEAMINIVLSIILVSKFGLEGIAVGTAIGMLYRMIYLVGYIHKYTIHRSVWKTVKRILISFSCILISYCLISVLDRTGSTTFLLWLKNGLISGITFGIITFVLNIILDKKTTILVIEHMKKRHGR